MPRKVATQRDELSFKSHSVRKRSELKKKFGPDTGISYRSSNPAFLMVSDRKEARNPPTPPPPPGKMENGLNTGFIEGGNIIFHVKCM